MTPATVPLADACSTLGISEKQFYRSYRKLFSDPRPPHLRKRGANRVLFRLEVEMATQPGGWEMLAQRRAEAERRQKLAK